MRDQFPDAGRHQANSALAHLYFLRAPISIFESPFYKGPQIRPGQPDN